MTENIPSYWSEICTQCKLSWPLSLSLILQYLVEPMSIAFCGHLGQIELASVSMAISIIYVVVISTGRGLAFGGDTFLSQTYGSDYKLNVGVYLQKGIIFSVMWSMPLIGLLLNTEKILLLLQQDPSVARLAQTFIDVFMPGVLGYFLMFLMMRFLICQNQVFPLLLIYIVCCGVNALLNYCLVYVAGMGIRGSAIALMMTYYIILILTVLYIRIRRIYTETWGGWSTKCLEDWGDYSAITTSSVGMTILNWLCTSISTYICGVISPFELSVYSISFQIEAITWLPPCGIRDTCAIRIGQFLGAGKPKFAVHSVKVAFVMTGIISFVIASTIFGCRYLLPIVFTSNKNIIEYTASVLRITALYSAFMGCASVGTGIVRAIGKQMYGILIVCANMLVALPIGVSLLFKTDLGIIGLWSGYTCGIIVRDLIIIIYVVSIKWNKEAEKAQERAKVGHKIVIKADSRKPSETSGLLASSSTKLYDNSLKYLKKPQTNKTQRNLVLKRLAVLFFSLTILSIGICVRVFVNINSPTIFSEQDNTTSTNVRDTTLSPN